jgi:hypothetical protein
MSEVFGFHDFDENLFSDNDYTFTENYYDMQNVLNVLGWFPFLGLITGSMRLGGTTAIYLGDDDSHRHSHKKYYRVSTIRSIIEMLSLGFVFAIPDIVCSRRRKKRIRLNKSK